MRAVVWACRGRSGQCPRAAEWTATTSETLRVPMPCTTGSSRRWELSVHEVRIGRGERVKIDTAGSRGVQRCEKKLWMKKKYLLD